MRVILKDATTKAQSYSETQILTSHIEPAQRATPLPAEGASYKAFVDLYKQTSTITAEYKTCVVE